MFRNLKKIREQRGLTQKQLGEAAGFSASFISLLEQGTRQTTIDGLSRIAEALRVPLSVLVDEGENVGLVDYLESMMTRQGLTWMDLGLGDHVVARLQHGFVPPVSVLRRLSQRLGCPLSELCLKAGYINEVEDELLIALEDEQVREIVLLLVRNFPARESRQAVVDMIKNAMRINSNAV